MTSAGDCLRERSDARIVIGMLLLLGMGAALLITRPWSWSEDLPLGTYQGGDDFGRWSVTYDGYGTASVVEPADSAWRVIDLQPVIDPPQAGTAAALVRGQRETSGDLVLNLKMRTLSQNATSRKPRQSPHPWEVAWVMWNATSREGPGDQGTGIATDVTEHSYYLALKPDGWELGKLDQALFTRGDDGGQRYLATGQTPTFPVGTQWRDVTISQVGATITAEVDGEVLTTFTDGPGSEGFGPWSDYPEQRVYTTGALGLYTEDAHVQFKDIVVTQP